MRHRKEIYEREKKRRQEEDGEELLPKSTEKRNENSCDRQLLNGSQIGQTSDVGYSRSDNKECERISRRGAFEMNAGIITLNSLRSTSGPNIYSPNSSPVRSVYMSSKRTSSHTVKSQQSSPERSVYMSGLFNKNYALSSRHYQQYEERKRSEEAYNVRKNIYNPIPVIGQQIDSLRDDAMNCQEKDLYQSSYRTYSEKSPLENDYKYTSNHSGNRQAPIPIDYQYMFDHYSRPLQYPYGLYNDSLRPQPWLTKAAALDYHYTTTGIANPMPWNYTAYQHNPVYTNYRPSVPSILDTQINSWERSFPSLQSYQTQNTTQHTYGCNADSIMSYSNVSLPYQPYRTDNTLADSDHNTVSNLQVSVQPETALGIVTTMHVQNVCRETVSRQIEIVPLTPPPKPPDFLLEKSAHIWDGPSYNKLLVDPEYIATTLNITETQKNDKKQSSLANDNVKSKITQDKDDIKKKSTIVKNSDKNKFSSGVCKNDVNAFKTPINTEQSWTESTKSRAKSDNSNYYKVSDQLQTSSIKDGNIKKSSHEIDSVQKSSKDTFEKGGTKMSVSELNVKPILSGCKQRKGCEVIKQDSHKPLKKRILEDHVNKPTFFSPLKEKDKSDQTYIPLGRKTVQHVHKKSVKHQESLNNCIHKRKSGAMNNLKGNRKGIKYHQKDTGNKIKSSATFTTYVKKVNVNASRSNSKKNVVVKEADSSTSDRMNINEMPQRKGGLLKDENKTSHLIEGTQNTKDCKNAVCSQDKIAKIDSAMIDENNNAMSGHERNKVISAYEIHRHLEPSCTHSSVSEKTESESLNETKSQIDKQRKVDGNLRVAQNSKQINNITTNRKCHPHEDKSRNVPLPRSKQYLQLFGKNKGKNKVVEKLEEKAAKRRELMLKIKRCLNPVTDKKSSAALTSTADNVKSTAHVIPNRAQQKYLKNRILERFANDQKIKILSNKLNKQLEIQRNKVKHVTNKRQSISAYAGNDEKEKTVKDKTTICNETKKRHLLHKNNMKTGKIALRECSVVLENKPLKSSPSETNSVTGHIGKREKQLLKADQNGASSTRRKTVDHTKPRSKKLKVKEQNVSGFKRKHVVYNEDIEKHQMRTKKTNVETKTPRKKALSSRGKYVMSTPTTYKVRPMNITNMKEDKKLENVKIRFLRACYAAKRLLSLRKKARILAQSSDLRKLKSCNHSSNHYEKDYCTSFEKKSTEGTYDDSHNPSSCDTPDSRQYPDTTTIVPADTVGSYVTYQPKSGIVGNVSYNRNSNVVTATSPSDETGYSDVVLSLQEPLIATDIPSPFEHQHSGEFQYRKRSDSSSTLSVTDGNFYDSDRCLNIESMVHGRTQTPVTQSSLKTSPYLGQAKFSEFFGAVLQKHLGIESCPEYLLGIMQTDILDMYKKYIQAKAMISQTDQTPLQNVVPPILVSPPRITAKYPESYPFSCDKLAKTSHQRELNYSFSMLSPENSLTEKEVSMTKDFSGPGGLHDTMFSKCSTASRTDDSGVYSGDSFNATNGNFIEVPLDDLRCMYTDYLVPDCHDIVHSPVVSENSETFLKNYLSSPGQNEKLTKQSTSNKFVYRNVFDDAVADMIQNESFVLSDNEHSMLESLYGDDDSAIVPDILNGIRREDLFTPSSEERKTSCSTSSDCNKAVNAFDSQRHLQPCSTQQVTPFQARIRSERRKRYHKRLPPSMCKAKSNKVGMTEKELYKDADEFLSNFDASQKRKCRLADLDQKKKFRLNIFEYVEKRVEHQQKKNDKKTSESETSEVISVKENAENSYKAPSQEMIVEKDSVKTDIDDTKTDQDLAKTDKDSTKTDKDLAKTDKDSTKTDKDLAKTDKDSTKTDKDGAKADINKQFMVKKLENMSKDSKHTETAYKLKKVEVLVTEKRKRDTNVESETKVKVKKKKTCHKESIGLDLAEHRVLSEKSKHSNDSKQNVVKSKMEKGDIGKDLQVKCEKIPPLLIKNKKTGLVVVQNEKKRKTKENKSGHFKAVTKRLNEAGTVAPPETKISEGCIRCPACVKVYKLGWKMKQHFRKEHKDWCQTCAVKFPDMDARTDHLNQGHDVELYCDVCETSFSHKKSYKAHLQRPSHLLRDEIVKSKQLAVANKRCKFGVKIQEVKKGAEKKPKHPKNPISPEVAECTATAFQTSTCAVSEKGNKSTKELDVQKTDLDKPKQYCSKCKTSYVKFSAHLKTLKHRMSGTDEKKVLPLKIKKPKQKKTKAVLPERPEMSPQTKNPVIELTNLLPATNIRSPPRCKPVLLVKNVVSTLPNTNTMKTGYHTTQTETSRNQSRVTEWIEIGDNNDVCVIEALSSPDPINFEKLKSMNVDKYLSRKPERELDLSCNEQLEYADHVLRPDHCVVVVTSGSELD